MKGLLGTGGASGGACQVGRAGQVAQVHCISPTSVAVYTCTVVRNHHVELLAIDIDTSSTQSQVPCLSAMIGVGSDREKRIVGSS